LKTSEVNFSNILRAAFTLVNPKAQKKDNQVISHFVLLGSKCVNPKHKIIHGNGAKAMPGLISAPNSGSL